jgi:hypothetical protein
MPGQTFYNLAIADFFKLPVIGDINLSGYSGAVGGSIRALVTDNFQLKSVKVKIETAAGTLVEQGEAALSADGLNWEYQNTKANNPATGSVISVIATDTPDHQIVKQKTL